MVVSILKIVITPDTICDNLVDFPKSRHICTSFERLEVAVYLLAHASD